MKNVKIYIHVEDGFINNIYTDDPSMQVTVDVIDLDGDDERADEERAHLKHIEKEVKAKKLFQIY